MEAALSFEKSVAIRTGTHHCNGETTDVPSNTMYSKLSLSFIFFRFVKFHIRCLISEMRAACSPITLLILGVIELKHEVKAFGGFEV